MKILLWDKTSNINGVPASHFMGNHPEFNTSDVFLVNDDFGATQRIESVNVIKGILKLSPETTFEEMVVEYEKQILNPPVAEAIV